MLRIGLCDDNADARLLLQDALERTLEINGWEAQFFQFSSGEGLLDWYRKHVGELDLVFLDMEMKALSGIDTARQLRTIDDSLQLVFCTSYSDYVFDGYGVGALGYLLKPPTQAQLQDVLQRTQTALLRALDRGSLSAAAEELGIRDLLGRSLFALSGGEKQKIAFASVYAMEPEVCLLDEPSSNLDARAIEDLRRHLALLKAQGKTILVAEHRLSYLMDVADHVLYLEGGRITGDWTPAEFRRIPAQRRQEMGLRAIDLREERPASPPPPAAAPRLEVRDVTLGYEKQPVLQGLSLQAAPGEIIALAGPNGAGKTTLSRFLCGLHRESGGQLLWEGRPQSPRERRGRAGLVMQDVNYQLFAESVAAECSFGLRRPDTALAEEALRELGLWELRDRHPNTLSGGQKQRLAAAAAVVQGRELLVFDEPTSGLDYDSMVRLAELLRRLSERGKVIFLVTHDFEFVCRTCTRVLALAGREGHRNLPVTAETLPALREIFHVR